jgi:ABC-type Fe3+-siderophore transport system permease subunit
MQLAMNKLSTLVPVLALCFAACTCANVHAFSTAPVRPIVRERLLCVGSAVHAFSMAASTSDPD